MSETESREYPNERLGRLAQTKIVEFVESSHLNYSVSNPDLDGWDIWVSVPRSKPIDGSSYFDSDPPRTSAFIQVKGTINQRRRCSVALSHWKTALMPLPWFFVVLEYDTPPTPARMYVVHVGADLIEKVTKRLRMEGAAATDNIPPRLHALEMDLTWNEEHEVPCTDMALRNALMSHAGEDMSAYAQRKLEWKQNAERAVTKHEFVVHIDAPAEVAYERIAEWALGIQPELRVDRLEHIEYIWDIPRTHKTRSDVTLSLGARPSLGKVQVRLRNTTGTEHATVDADIYCNFALMPFLPKELWGLRVVARYLDMTFWPQRKRATIKYDIPETLTRISLLELANLARMLRLCQNPGYMEYEIPIFGQGVHYQTKFENFSGEISDREFFEAAEAAVALVPQYGVPLDLEVDPDVLAEHAQALQEFHQFNSRQGVKARLESPRRDGLADGDLAAFLWFPTVTLGHYALVAAVLVESTVQVIDERVCVEAQPIIVRKWSIADKVRIEWAQCELPQLIADLISELRVEFQGKICPILSDETKTRVRGALPEGTSKDNVIFG